MDLPESEWPLKKDQPKDDLPEQIKVVMKLEAHVVDTLLSRIKIERFSSYIKLVRVTARVLSLYRRKPRVSFKNACSELSPADIKKAECSWYLDVQVSIREEVSKGNVNRLCPTVRDDGVVVVGGRADKWFQVRYDNELLVLLHTSIDFLSYLLGICMKREAIWEF